LSSICDSNAVEWCTKGSGICILVEGGQEFHDVRVATGIPTVATGLQIYSGKRATSLNNEIGPHCDYARNVLIIRKIAILDSCLDLIECLSAGNTDTECATNCRLEMCIRSRGIATSRVGSSFAQLFLVDGRRHPGRRRPIPRSGTSNRRSVRSPSFHRRRR
jgi:hypothetical protein